HPRHHVDDQIVIGQQRDPEVISVRDVETRAWRYQDVPLFQEIESKLSVVEATRERAAVDPDEGIHRPFGGDDGEILAPLDALQDCASGFEQTSARSRQLMNRLVSTKGCLHRELSRNVRAQAK